MLVSESVTMTAQICTPLTSSIFSGGGGRSAIQLLPGVDTLTVGGGGGGSVCPEHIGCGGGGEASTNFTQVFCGYVYLS